MSLLLWDDAAALQRRLELLGLTGIRRLVVHQNRSVMVTLARSGVLRIHRGYGHAPDRVLRAVIAFLDPRSPRSRTRRAERELLAFPVDQFVASRPMSTRRDPPRPGDDKILAALRMCHRRLNREHFAGRLEEIPFRLSGRMRSRLGELAVDGRCGAREIALSRRHIRRDPWEEVERTLLHEMVHQWQAEEGLPVDHGVIFRRKAREVGVEPTAKRYVASKRKAARYQ
jgi:hypothetical protein